MTFGKVLYWSGLAVAILTVVGLPIWAFGGWMGSKAFTEKNRDLWMGRGIGCWLGLFALFLFLLPRKELERFYAFGNQRASVSVRRVPARTRSGRRWPFLRGLHRGLPTCSFVTFPARLTHPIKPNRSSHAVADGPPGLEHPCC